MKEKKDSLENLIGGLKGEEKEIAINARDKYMSSRGYEMNNSWIRDALTFRYVKHNLDSYRHFNRFDKEHYLSDDIVNR